MVVPNAVGVFNGEGPPVPIPNTEVKLTSADNTCLETDREDRSMPTSKGLAQVKPFAFASLAQQVEHAAVNRRVVGSNPTGGANGYCRHIRDGNTVAVAPPVGLEPTTLRLTAACSTY